MRQAVAFLIGQLLVCGSLLFFLNDMSRWLAWPCCSSSSIRVQARDLLAAGGAGHCFNWGMLMAWSDTQNHLPLAAVAMWLGACCGRSATTASTPTWMCATTSLGLHSTAMRFGDQGKLWIGSQPPWRCGPGAAYAIGMSWAYYVGIAAVALHLASGLRHQHPQLPPVPRQPVAGRADRWRAP